MQTILSTTLLLSSFRLFSQRVRWKCIAKLTAARGGYHKKFFSCTADFRNVTNVWSDWTGYKKSHLSCSGCVIHKAAVGTFFSYLCFWLQYGIGMVSFQDSNLLFLLHSPSPLRLWHCTFLRPCAFHTNVVTQCHSKPTCDFHVNCAVVT
jgi:hypothetical protein